MPAVVLTRVPLPANGTYTQGTMDRFNDREPVGSVYALVYADKGGVLYIEESDDEGVNWSQTVTKSVLSNTTTEVSWTALTKRWYRFRYANGAAAQGKFVLIQQSQPLELKDVQLTGGSSIEFQDATLVVENVKLLGSIATNKEVVTVGDTVASLTEAKYGANTKAALQVQVAPLRYWQTGDDPTGTEGFLAQPGDIIFLDSAENIANFKAIRIIDTNAKLTCQYFA
ncbi:MAG TPA: hypothetical protein PK923_08950 [Bacteroidales bacterium]|jgi:hypothetical protein|nr:hypothetical protein [Bacteroidales bacterium]